MLPAAAREKRVRNKIPPVVRWAVSVDTATGISKAEVEAVVAATLNDPRSWSPIKKTRFVMSPWATALLRIRVLTPKGTDRFCAPFRTQGYKSCSKNWDVALNADRWSLGAAAAAMPLDQYRIYMVNHEVGHSLGEDHESCPGPGSVAPILLQQTIGLQGCTPNPWPKPNAAVSSSTTLPSTTLPSTTLPSTTLPATTLPTTTLPATTLQTTTVPAPTTTP